MSYTPKFLEFQTDGFLFLNSRNIERCLSEKILVSVVSGFTLYIC